MWWRCQAFLRKNPTSPKGRGEPPGLFVRLHYGSEFRLLVLEDE
jgi:hypothetical protein